MGSKGLALEIPQAVDAGAWADFTGTVADHLGEILKGCEFGRLTKGLWGMAEDLIEPILEARSVIFEFVKSREEGSEDKSGSPEDLQFARTLLVLFDNAILVLPRIALGEPLTVDAAAFCPQIERLAKGMKELHEEGQAGPPTPQWQIWLADEARSGTVDRPKYKVLATKYKVYDADLDAEKAEAIVRKIKATRKRKIIPWERRH